MRAARLGRHAPIYLEPEHQAAVPGGPPLERSVGMQYLEALFSDVVEPEDGAYWFTVPPGGWTDSEVVRKRATQVEESPFVTGLRNPDEPGFAGRTRLLDMRVGDTFEAGVIQGGAYVAGILVDVGCDWNGLLPVDQAGGGKAWRALRDDFPLGGTVAVRVAAVNPAPLARFPLLLEIVGAREEVAACLCVLVDRGGREREKRGERERTSVWVGGRPWLFSLSPFFSKKTHALSLPLPSPPPASPPKTLPAASTCAARATTPPPWTP